MIGLCHKCGFMGDPPSKGPTPEEWTEMQSKLRATEDVLDNAQISRHLLQKQLDAKDQAFHALESKLNTMLEILMAPTEAKRVSVISRIGKRLRSNDLLSSIRKANQANEL